jgi:3'-phosphoadenosine 5'-phosphosulfate sulfotransferase (PAPS reductase)/FAD synthetase
MVNPDQYDYIVVAFSAGKDSLACILYLLDLGVPKEKIELWHHEVDGRETGHFMDWTVTPGYCKAVADALELPIYYSWRVGGFRGEMLRENERTKPIKFETPEGIKQSGGKGGQLSTRRKFPMATSNLNFRWCSAYLKIEAGRAAMNNQARFNHKKTLMITGERAQESIARSKYKQFEIMSHCDTARKKQKEFEPAVNEGKKEKTNRHVDAWRPVFKWDIKEVWDIIKQHSINPHPCYRLGWGRCSCAGCIFSKADQFASLEIVDPSCFYQIAQYEEDFGLTIKSKVKQKDKVKTYYNIPLIEYARTGTPFKMKEKDVLAVNSETFDEPVFLRHWEYPPGAFADQTTGPT